MKINKIKLRTELGPVELTPSYHARWSAKGSYKLDEARTVSFEVSCYYNGKDKPMNQDVVEVKITRRVGEIEIKSPCAQKIKHEVLEKVSSALKAYLDKRPEHKLIYEIYRIQSLIESDERWIGYKKDSIKGHLKAISKLRSNIRKGIYEIPKCEC